MYSVALGGTYIVGIDLGLDDILRIQHTVRSGKDKEKIRVSPAAVYGVTRTLKIVNAELLHRLFNHCSEEKLYQTLLNTFGFKAVRLEIPTCTWCALGKSVRHGLSNKRFGGTGAEEKSQGEVVREQCRDFIVP